MPRYKELRMPFAPFARHLPERGQHRLLGTNTRVLREAPERGLTITQAKNWCERLGVRPDDVWDGWPTNAEEAAIRRFMLNTTPDGACWGWTGDTDRNGYGVFCVGSTKFSAHSWSLEHIGGVPRPTPTSMGLHSCDNPPCTNPDHLRWGEHQDNSNDAVLRDRHARGERNGHAVLTADQVVTLRERVADGVSRAVVAADYGIRPGTVTAIARGDRWAHVGGPILRKAKNIG